MCSSGFVIAHAGRGQSRALSIPLGVPVSPLFPRRPICNGSEGAHTEACDPSCCRSVCLSPLLTSFIPQLPLAFAILFCDVMISSHLMHGKWKYLSCHPSAGFFPLYVPRIFSHTWRFAAVLEHLKRCLFVAFLYAVLYVVPNKLFLAFWIIPDAAMQITYTVALVMA